MFRLFIQGLARGCFRGQPFELVPGGLYERSGQIEGRERNRDQVYFRVPDTPDLQSEMKLSGKSCRAYVPS